MKYRTKSHIWCLQRRTPSRPSQTGPPRTTKQNYLLVHWNRKPLSGAKCVRFAYGGRILEALWSVCKHLGTRWSLDRFGRCQRPGKTDSIVGPILQGGFVLLSFNASWRCVCCDAHISYFRRNLTRSGFFQRLKRVSQQW
jgi:hypothetical protein